MKKSDSWLPWLALVIVFIGFFAVYGRQNTTIEKQRNEIARLHAGAR